MRCIFTYENDGENIHMIHMTKALFLFLLLLFFSSTKTTIYHRHTIV